MVPAVTVVTVLGLLLDHVADRTGQALLSVGTWVVLLALVRYLTPRERAQTALVVVVATMAEVVGSILWGIYRYRLGNLPPFVPPGHGLVYVTGLRISQSAPVRRHGRAFVALVLAGLLGWATAGLLALPRADVAGAVGAATLAVFLLRGRAPTVYAGVFVFVAFLELYGTAIGTWRWAAHVPGLGVPDGNPPSGAASGYVFFDIAALTLAPALVASAEAVGRRWSSLVGGVRRPLPADTS
jgi:hypothetical protein